MRARTIRVAALATAAALTAAGCTGDNPEADTSVGSSVEAAPSGASAESTSDESASGGAAPADSESSVVPDGSQESGPGTTAATDSAGWEGIDFLNFDYQLSEEVVTVTDGELTRGEQGDDDYLHFMVNEVLFGDIGGDDDTEEAIVTIFYTPGGTGRFTDAYVYSLVDGEPQLVGRAGVGDRALGGIVGVKVDGGDMLVLRDEGEGACCPTRRVRTRHHLDQSGLVEVGDATEGTLVFVTDDEGPPVEITFLPGTTSAFIVVDSSSPELTTFEATEGQEATITVDDRGEVDHGTAVELVYQAGEEILLTVARGDSGRVTLPASGFYALRAVTDDEANTQLMLELDIH
jgi:hypothetical protein